jgi:hypothetical protein
MPGRKIIDKSDALALLALRLGAEAVSRFRSHGRDGTRGTGGVKLRRGPAR